MVRPSSRFLMAAVAIGAAWSGMALPALAADLPRYERPYRHAYGYEDRYRGPAPIYVARCPRQEPADYRPRLVGEPDCQAARPFGLSPTLYGPRIGTEWGVDY